VEQDDVDVVGAHFLAEAVEVGPHVLLGARVRLREDDDVVALHRLERRPRVRVAAVLIGEVPEVEAVVHALDQQVGEAAVAHLPDLVRAVVDAVGPGALREPGHLDARSPERDDVGRELLLVRCVEMAGGKCRG
jgi:hypothetical protein